MKDAMVADVIQDVREDGSVAVVSHLITRDESGVQTSSNSGRFPSEVSPKDSDYHVHVTSLASVNADSLSDRRPEAMLSGIDGVSLKPDAIFRKIEQLHSSFLLTVDNDQMSYVFDQTAEPSIKEVALPAEWDASDSLPLGPTTKYCLSTPAKYYTATYDPRLRQKLVDIIEKLDTAQNPKLLARHDATQFDLLEQYKPYPQIWTLYYALHKIRSGLSDAYELVDNQIAITIASGIGEWTFALTHEHRYLIADQRFWNLVAEHHAYSARSTGHGTMSHARDAIVSGLETHFMYNSGICHRCQTGDGTTLIVSIPIAAVHNSIIVGIASNVHILLTCNGPNPFPMQYDPFTVEASSSEDRRLHVIANGQTPPNGIRSTPNTSVLTKISCIPTNHSEGALTHGSEFTLGIINRRESRRGNQEESRILRPS